MTSAEIIGVSPLLAVYRELEIYRAITAALGIPAELLQSDRSAPEPPDPDTFQVSHDGGYQHIVGDLDCTEGWCDRGNGYPKPCQHCADGLVHADFGDENYDCDYWLYTKCDVCGEAE